MYGERNHATAGRVTFSGAGTAFDVLGMGVMSTGLAGASVATLVMAGWECGVLAITGWCSHSGERAMCASSGW